MASEEYTLRGTIYFKNELLLMLRAAGFREITVHGNYTDEPPTADDEELVFVALRYGSQPTIPTRPCYGRVETQRAF